MRRLFLLPILLGSTLVATNSITPSANADEIWMSEGRTIQWIHSKGSTAIFKMQTLGGRQIYFHIEGLAYDVSGNRGFYNGYWAEEDNGRRNCSTRRLLTGRAFGTSSNWGNLSINFTSNSFPYSWTALLGKCNGRFNERIEAVPMVQAN